MSWNGMVAYDWTPELTRLELGERVAMSSDESSPLMHRLTRAVGGVYDVTHNEWVRAALHTASGGAEPATRPPAECCGDRQDPDCGVYWRRCVISGERFNE